MAILNFFETHSVALILLTATTMFALIIIIKIHAVRSDLDRAIRALPKHSDSNSGVNFDGMNDQMEQMAVELEGVSATTTAPQPAQAPASTGSSSDNQPPAAALEELLLIGFPDDVARVALEAGSNDVQKAMDYLLAEDEYVYM